MKKAGIIKSILLLGIASFSLLGCKNPGSKSSDPFKPDTSYNNSIQIEELEFPVETYNLALNKSLTIKPNILPKNATNKNLNWSSSDSEIVSINNSGYAYAWGIGEVTITARTTDGSRIAATCRVRSYGVEITKLSFENDVREAYAGEAFYLEPTIYPNNASMKELVYESSNDQVCSVSDDGLVTCLKEGQSTIKVRSVANPEVSATCLVKVKVIKLERFSLNASTIYMRVNENYTLKPRFFPSNASNKNIKYSISDESIATISKDGVIKGKKTGLVTLTAITEESELVDTCRISVSGKNSIITTSLKYCYKDYFDNNIYGLDCCPVFDTTKILVVPVWFNDSNTYITEDKKESVRTDIQKTFFGSDAETGWKSVKTYYAEDSFQRFNLDGFVTKWFECGMNSTKFVTDNGTYTGQLVSSAVEWAKKVYPDMDFKEFDSDRNGYLDAVIFVYGSCDYSYLRNDDYTNMWAYTSWLGTGSKRNYDSPTPNVFFWGSYDFMYTRGSNARNHSGVSNYGSGDTRYCELDAHTYIHEMGHALGLDDYYDYSYQYMPAGCFSMQDYNVGMHDPYSAMALGWVDPIIPKESCEIEIGTYAKTGNVVLLTPEFNDIDSPFDEYLLVELYSPEGLNEFDTRHSYGYNGVQGATSIGVRLWHVDARLVYAPSYRSISPDKVTCDPSNMHGMVYHMTKNTYYGTGQEMLSPLGRNYADYNLLQLIRNDRNESFKPQSKLSNGSLFYQDDTFTMSKYKSQFVNGELLNSKEELGWEFTINSIDGGYAIISFNKVN